MLRLVRPSLFFWYLSSFGFSYLAVMSTYNMDIFKNRPEEIMIGVVLNLILYFSWYFGFLAVTLLFGYLLRNPNADRLFRGHKRLGKAIGAALMLFGNILVYYFSEKSLACMFAYLFLACTFLCGLCYIQPFTNFGVVDFLLSASLNVALSRFGIRVGYTWLVLGACVAVAGMRYWLDPMEAPAETVEEAEMALQGGSDEGVNVLSRSLSI